MRDRHVFTNPKFETHMPFLNGKTLMFCSGDGIVMRPESSAVRPGDPPRHGMRRYQPWKLMYCGWKSRHPRRIDTGLPVDSVECSPAFYEAEGKVFVSFIGGAFHRDFRHDRLIYHLYVMSGPSLDRLEAPIQFSDRPTNLGFVSPRYVCTLVRGNLVLTDRDSGEQSEVELPVLSKLLRVTYRADHLDSLLVTGLDEWDLPMTLLVRLDTGDVSEIRTNEPVYKCSIYGPELVYARQTGANFEQRQLVHSDFQSVLCPEKLRVKRGQRHLRTTA